MPDQSDNYTRFGRLLVREAMFGAEHSTYTESSTVSLQSGEIDYCADYAAQEMATDG